METESILFESCWKNSLTVFKNWYRIREEKEEYIPKISPRPEFAPLWAEPSGTTLGAQNETSLPSLG